MSDDTFRGDKPGIRSSQRVPRRGTCGALRNSKWPTYRIRSTTRSTDGHEDINREPPVLSTRMPRRRRRCHSRADRGHPARADGDSLNNTLKGDFAGMLSRPETASGHKISCDLLVQIKLVPGACSQRYLHPHRASLLRERRSIESCWLGFGVRLIAAGSGNNSRPIGCTGGRLAQCVFDRVFPFRSGVQDYARHCHRDGCRRRGSPTRPLRRQPRESTPRRGTRPVAEGSSETLALVNSQTRSRGHSQERARFRLSSARPSLICCWRASTPRWTRGRSRVGSRSDRAQ